MTAARLQLETRRLEASKLILSGVSSKSILREFRISRTTLSRWKRKLAAADNDPEVLRAVKATGRKSRLQPWEKQELKDWLLADVRTDGDGQGKRNKPRNREVAQWVEARFGVSYDKDHIGRLVRKLSDV